MSKDKIDYTPAFPMMGHTTPNNYDVDIQGGMDLRDYFAGQILAGLFSDPQVDTLSREEIGRMCYQQADAMMKARR